MKKQVILSIGSMKYSGDYVGPNFCFNFHVNGIEKKIRKKLKTASRPLDKSNTLDFWVDQDTSQVQVKIDVKETDPILDDEGFYEGVLSVGEINSKTSNILKVKIVGKGWEKGKTGNLEFEVVATVRSSIRTIKKVKPDGWLKATFKNGKIFSLPYMLKVSILEEKNSRQYFRIEEGLHLGKEASVPLTDSKQSYLSDEEKHSDGALCVYQVSTELLQIDDIGFFKAEIDKTNPLEFGEYDIEIPDSPHLKGKRYEKDSRYAKTWFRIRADGNRYLHVGISSDGCATVKLLSKWTKIYLYLIRSRKNKDSVWNSKDY